MQVAAITFKFTGFSYSRILTQVTIQNHYWDPGIQFLFFSSAAVGT
jgi:hypothetical protein